eukprot:12311954-Alexandrium_andersonii.AAC.1
MRRAFAHTSLSSVFLPSTDPVGCNTLPIASATVVGLDSKELIGSKASQKYRTVTDRWGAMDIPGQ